VKEFRTILGIRFFVGSLETLLGKTRSGGLIVVPAAPALAELREAPEYRRAVENASFAIMDSGFLVLLWFIRKGELLSRISGLRFLRGLVTDPAFRRKDATYWIMPSREDLEANLKWLNSEGVAVTAERCYIAPRYPQGCIVDELLLTRIEAYKPSYIIINVGGGTQEILGSFLFSRLSYQPAIICTGAAIAFLSGRQASIPSWADRLMFGWFARCLSEPRRFVPRYLRGLRLIGILFRYADRPVPFLAQSDTNKVLP